MSAVSIRAGSVKPLRINLSMVSDTFDNQLRGQFLMDGKVAQAQQLEIRVYNESGAEVSHQVIPWEEAYVRPNKTIIPFFADMTGKAVAERAEIRGEILDIRGRVVARGRTMVDRAEDLRVPALSSLSLGQTGDMAIVSFVYDHVGEASTVFPQLRVYEHASDGPVAIETLQQVAEVKDGERLKLNFEFPVPKEPESYLVVVDILNEAKASLTGSQETRLVVEGDFANIDGFKAFPDHFWRAGSDVQLIVSGVATKGDPLYMMLEVFGMREGQDKKKIFEENREVFLDLHDFSEVISFVPRDGFPQFEAGIKLFRNGQVIESKVLKTEYFAPQGAMDWFFGGRWRMYGLAFLILSLLGFGYWKTSGEKTLIGLFFLGLLLPSVSFAEWESDWTYPEVNAIFSPVSTTSFNILRFEGSVYDGADLTPFFNPPLSAVTLDFTDPEDDQNVVTAVVPLETITIAPDQEWYQFDFDLGTIQDDLSDGSWQVRLNFFRSDDFEGNIDLVDFETNDLGVIVIDSQPPTVTTNAFPPGVIFSGPAPLIVTCDDGEGSGCWGGAEEGVYPAEYDVTGNFCADYPNRCRTEGRIFQLCDRAGNCAEHELERLSYITAFGGGEGGSFTYITDEGESITITGTDVVAHLGHALNATVSLIIDLGAMSEHACGDETSPFFNDGSYCREREVVCVDPANPGFRGMTVPGGECRDPDACSYRFAFHFNWCFTEPLPTWQPSVDESACETHTCGGDFNQVTTYACIDAEGNEVDGLECQIAQPPAEQESCGLPDCVWDGDAEWSTCTLACDQTRTVGCEDLDEVGVEIGLCDVALFPGDRQDCTGDACIEYTWEDAVNSDACDANLCGTALQQVTTQVCMGSDGNQAANASSCAGDPNPAVSVSCELPACVWEDDEDTWGTCSVACGGGIQTRNVRCLDPEGGLATSESLCTETKPLEENSCNTEICETYAWVGLEDRSDCAPTHSCGELFNSTTTFECHDSSGDIVEDVSLCEGSQPENVVASCELPACGWDENAAWGTCAESCDQTRTIACQDSLGEAVDSELCDPDLLPEATQSCTGGECVEYTWQNSLDDSACKNNACGLIFESVITQVCTGSDGSIDSDGDLCAGSAATPVYANCGLPDCSWEENAAWEDCSVSCGGGTQTRDVRCVDPSNNVITDESLCVSTQPDETQNCNETACETYGWVGTLDQSVCDANTCGENLTKVTEYTCRDSGGNLMTDLDLCGGAQTQPADEVVNCELPACETYSWQLVGNWSTCDAVCEGEGVQSKEIKCLQDSDGAVVFASFCEGQTPPEPTQACTGASCVTAITTCEELQLVDIQSGTTYTIENYIDCSATNPEHENYPGSLWSQSWAELDLMDQQLLEKSNYGEATWNAHQGFRPVLWHDIADFPGILAKDVIFNGQDNTVQYLTVQPVDAGIDAASQVGLFEKVYFNSQIKNLRLTDVEILGFKEVGGLAGYLWESSIVDSQVTGTVTATGRVGGIAGELNNDAHLVNTSFAGDVLATEDFFGGLVGFMDGSSVRDGTTSGTVTGRDHGGGLVGDARGSTISQSSSSSDIVGDDRLGGSVGSFTAESTLEESFASGSVSGDNNFASHHGGLVGYADTSMIRDTYALGSVTGGDNHVGGLLGSGWHGSTIENSYALGVVQSGGSIGGLTATFNDSNCTSSYWDKSTSGEESSDCGVGHITNDLLDQTTYVGWNFVPDTGVWQKPTDLHYPCLAWQDEAECVTGELIVYTWEAGDPDVTACGANTCGTEHQSVTNFFCKDPDGNLASDDLYCSGTRPEPVLGSCGFEECIDPLAISTCEQLQNTVFESSKIYRLVNDINCSATKPGFEGDEEKDLPAYADSIWAGDANHHGFRPLAAGTIQNMVLDGQGFKIQNLYIRPKVSGLTGYFGLFSSLIESSVQNLELANVEILEGDRPMGALAGFVRTSSIEDVIVSGDVSGAYQVGGVIGRVEFVDSVTPMVIAGVEFRGNVTGSEHHVGGLVGKFEMGRIENSSAWATVSAGQEGGGLVGELVSASEDNLTTIINSAAHGDVVTTGYHSGGLVGNIAIGSIQGSSASGDVSGDNRVGGLVGFLDQGSITDSYALGDVVGANGRTGGLVGASNFIRSPLTIERSYSIGNVTGTGGFVGLPEDITCTDSYWDTDTSGFDTGECADGKTTAQMLEASTYGNWDFETVWKKPSDTHYPCLQWMDDAQCVEGTPIVDPYNPDDDPTTISSCEELQLTVFESSKTYRLVNDIDCSATNPEHANYAGSIWEGDDVHHGFRPLSLFFAIETPLTSTVFDGQGFEIQNLYVEQKNGLTQYLGLFSKIVIDANSAVQNLKLVNVEIMGSTSSQSSWTGGLAGYLKQGVIDNVSVEGNIRAQGNHIGGLAGKAESRWTSTQGVEIRNVSTSVDIEGAQASYVGGLIGTLGKWNSVENSEASGNIVVEEGGYIGGLVGMIERSSVQGQTMMLDRVKALGNVTVNTGDSYVGGLVGYIGEQVTIQKSLAGGDVIVQNGGTYVGGFLGDAIGESDIYDSVALGNVKGDSRVGGFMGGSGTVFGAAAFGDVEGNTSVGGFSGWFMGWQESIQRSFSIGAVSSAEGQGFLGTQIGSMGCNGNFWDMDTSGQTTSECASGKTTNEMLDQSTYDSADWNFSSRWKKVSDTHYPCLQWMDDEMCEEGTPVVGPVINPDNDPTTISSCEELQLTVFEDTTTYTLVDDEGEDEATIGIIDCSATNPEFLGDTDVGLPAYADSIWAGHNKHYGFRPLQIGSSPFTSTGRVKFDGQGFEIQNLYIHPRSPGIWLGLFSSINSTFGEIRDLYLKDLQILNGDHSVGGLVGYIGDSSLQIINVSTSGTIQAQGHSIGGLVGRGQGHHKIENSSSSVEVSSESFSVGGLVGDLRAGTIKKSFATGIVSGNRGNAGGLLGYGFNTVIEESVATGAVSSSEGSAGGLLGYSQAARVSDSFAIGSVTGASGGGFIGGALQKKVTIKRSFSIGLVGSGVYGFGDARSCTSNYWDTDTSGVAVDEDCAEGKNTNQMLDITTYEDVNWDFDTVWKKPSPTYYPCLQWMDDALCIQAP